MRAPGFWFTPPGLTACLVWPFSLIWRLGAMIRNRRAKPVRAPVPVICIGNLTVGGGGKTPMAAALLQRAAARGHNVHLVSRGYGGSIKGPHLVDPRNDTASDVGDEPLLLASFAPVWVARNRAAGAQAAAEAGASLVLLDDGYQNPGLHKDHSILMVDAAQGFGNRMILPAGPLREPVGDGLARADVVVLVGTPAERKNALRHWPEIADAVAAELVPLQTGLELDGQKVVAFAGIARPEKFFATLRAMGADLRRSVAFPDHHLYATRVLDRLVREAASRDAMLITTEKDTVRLPPAYRSEVMALVVQMTLGDWSAVDAILPPSPQKDP